MAQKGQTQPRYGFGAPGRIGQSIATNALKQAAKLARKFDIVNEYAWTTVAKNSQLRAEAPNAFVTGYLLDKSQFQQFIEGYLNIGAQIIKDTPQASNWDPGRLFYKNLYKPSPDAKRSFNFPYFDNNIRSFSNNFDDTFSKVSSRGAQFGGSVGSAFRSAEQQAIGIAAAAGQSTGVIRSAAEAAGPGNMQNVINSVGDFTAAATGGSQSGMTGTYIETPKFYQYENTDAPLSIRFILANTIDEEDADNNLEFIHEFIRINRPNRKGPIEMTFPYIYHIEVPCQRYIEWAFLQDLQIELLGTKRKIQNRGGGCTIVPEAYGCTFQFKSLTVEAANFMADDLLCDNNCSFEDYTDKQATSDMESEEQLRAQKEAQEEAVQGYWTRERNTTQTPGENKGGSPGNIGSGEYVPKKNEYVPAPRPYEPAPRPYVPPNNQKQDEQPEDPLKIVPNVFEDSVSVEREPDFSGTLASPRNIFDPTEGGGYWANPNKPVDKTNLPETNYNEDDWETIEIPTSSNKAPTGKHSGSNVFGDPLPPGLRSRSEGMPKQIYKARPNIPKLTGKKTVISRDELNEINKKNK